MASLSNLLFGCFSGSSRVTCDEGDVSGHGSSGKTDNTWEEGDVSEHGSSGKTDKLNQTSKSKSESSAPVVTPYFAAGPRISVL